MRTNIYQIVLILISFNNIFQSRNQLKEIRSISLVVDQVDLRNKSYIHLDMIKKLANYIIRPQRKEEIHFEPYFYYMINRAVYQDKDLGDKEFTIGEYEFIRSDYDLRNPRGQKIQCSVFQPHPRKQDKIYDCIIFNHGNSGNRCSIFECLDFILDGGFIAVSFDFSGCGNSEGKYISLGHYEKYDIQAVVNFIRKFNYIGQIGLWGRSMGAASVLLYSELDQDIGAMCLDSPFRSLKSLIQDFMDKFKIIANLFGDILYDKVSKYVQQEVNLDIEAIQPIKSASKSRINAIFIHAVNDKIIDKSHTDDIVQVYKGRKKYYNVSGDHNDMRNHKLYEDVIKFFKESFFKNQAKINSSMEQLSLQSLDHNMEDEHDNQVRNFAHRKSKKSVLFFKGQDLGSLQSLDEEEDYVQTREFSIRKGKKKRETIILKNFVEISSNEELDQANQQNKSTKEEEEEKEKDSNKKINFKEYKEDKPIEEDEVNHRQKQERRNQTRSEKIIIIQGDISQSEDGLTSKESSPLPEDMGLIKFQSQGIIQYSKINKIFESTPISLKPNLTSFSEFAQIGKQNSKNEEELIPDEHGKNIPVTQDICKFMYSKTAI